MNRPYYKHKPIASIGSLAKALRIPLRELVWVVNNSESLYRPGPQQKKSDGTIREVFDARCPLKSIQEQINQRILQKVSYPLYLQGGIKDRLYPRDYVRIAELHVGAKTVINEDIGNFFPSIKTEQINKVWLRLFNFPPTVANCLTALTTYKGSLPQGAKTSSYLANLVFWDIEPEIVEALRKRNLIYSRLIDDITISSKSILSSSDKQFAIGTIRKQCTRMNFKLKKSKHRIETSDKAMYVNNIIVNKKAALPHDERARIRAAVHELKLISEQENVDFEYCMRRYNSINGRVCNLTRLHPGLGKQYRMIMDKIKRENIRI